MSHLTLTLDQSSQVFSQLALLKTSAYQNSKLCFGQTDIQLESNSSMWRTAASFFHGYFPSYTYGRDLKSLHPLVEAAGQRYYESARDASRDVTWSMASLKAIGEIKAAREGLQALVNHQYAAQFDKANLIKTSIDSLEIIATNIRKFVLEYIGKELATDQFSKEMVPALVLREKEDEIEVLKTRLAFYQNENARLYQQIEELLKSSAAESTAEEKAGDDS